MTILQAPNKIVTVAIGLSLLAMLLSYRGIIHALAIAAWIAWGYDELAYGVNWFRRTLGTVVIVMMVMEIVRLS